MVERIVREVVVVDENKALAVKHPSTVMMKDNIKSRIQIEDTLKMTTLRGTTLSMFLLQKI